MTASRTPRTDAFYKDRFKAPDAIAFARQLETELTAALARAESAERDAGTWKKRYLYLATLADDMSTGWVIDTFIEGAPSLETLEQVIDRAMQEPK